MCVARAPGWRGAAASALINPTVGGVHPTDLGMVRYADALEPVLRPLL